MTESADLVPDAPQKPILVAPAKAPRTRRSDKAAYWVIGCSGLLCALLLLPFIVLEAHSRWARGFWSITAGSLDVKPFTITLKLDDGDRERTLRFENAGEDSFKPLVLERNRGTKLISATVVHGEREKTTELKTKIDAGTSLSLTVHKDLTVTTSADYDAHM